MAVLLVHWCHFSGVSRVLHHVLVHHAHLLRTHRQVGYRQRFLGRGRFNESLVICVCW
jgi:hypothetical protein